MRSEGRAAARGAVQHVVNPGPIPDGSGMAITHATSSLVVRFDGAQITGQLIAAATYGPDGRQASATVVVPADTLRAAVAALEPVLEQYRPVAQTQAFLNAAEGMSVARRNGEYQ